jgi:hypothetical protein
VIVFVMSPWRQARTLSYDIHSVAGLFDALDQHPNTDLLLLDLNLPGDGFCFLAHEGWTMRGVCGELLKVRACLAH